MKIHADVARIPPPGNAFIARCFLTSRKATIGTAVRYPAQPGGVEESGPGANKRSAAT